MHPNSDREHNFQQDLPRTSSTDCSSSSAFPKLAGLNSFSHPKMAGYGSQGPKPFSQNYDQFSPPFSSRSNMFDFENFDKMPSSRFSGADNGRYPPAAGVKIPIRVVPTSQNGVDTQIPVNINLEQPPIRKISAPARPANAPISTQIPNQNQHPSRAQNFDAFNLQKKIDEMKNQLNDLQQGADSLNQRQTKQQPQKHQHNLNPPQNQQNPSKSVGGTPVIKRRVIINGQEQDPDTAIPDMPSMHNSSFSSIPRNLIPENMGFGQNSSFGQNPGFGQNSGFGQSFDIPMHRTATRHENAPRHASQPTATPPSRQTPPRHQTTPQKPSTPPKMNENFQETQSPVDSTSSAKTASLHSKITAHHDTIIEYAVQLESLPTRDLEHLELKELKKLSVRVKTIGEFLIRVLTKLDNILSDDENHLKISRRVVVRMGNFWMEKADDIDKRVGEAIKEKDVSDELEGIEVVEE